MTEQPSGVGGVVKYELRGHTALITLDRPEARNAVNGDVAEALGYLVKQTEADGDVRAVVLASSLEKVFCAGADLAEISRGNAHKLGTADGGFAGLIVAKRAKPWIAAVRGAALAGGCEIALSCDMIVASDDARFGLPEVKRGLYAGAGGPFRLPRALPRAIALELVATGDPLDAARAYQLGMVNRMVANGEVIDEALKLAEAITVNAPMSVVESLGIARQAGDLDEDEFWALSAGVHDKVFASEDAKEGPRAFLEKRPAQWQGR